MHVLVIMKNKLFSYDLQSVRFIDPEDMRQPYWRCVATHSATFSFLVFSQQPLSTSRIHHGLSGIQDSQRKKKDV